MKLLNISATTFKELKLFTYKNQNEKNGVRRKQPVPIMFKLRQSFSSSYFSYLFPSRLLSSCNQCWAKAFALQIITLCWNKTVLPQRFVV